MNLWLLNALIIESLALLGMVGAVKTRRTVLAFALGFNSMLPVTLNYLLHFPPFTTRDLLSLFMVILYLLHMNWLLLFQQRHTAISKLDAHLPAAQKYLLPFLLTNTAGWGYCLPFYFAARRGGPLNALDWSALVLYLLGTVLHFGSDYQKYRFKIRPNSRGKLLTSGFWRFSRHPNYFGDFLIYLSFALLGGHLGGWLAPVLNLLQYLGDAIPKNEQWAAERYGEAWQRYKNQTPMFFPFFKK